MSSPSISKFLALTGAAGLFVLVLWLVPHTPDPIVLFLQKSTGHAVVFVAHLVGLPAHYNMETQLFGVSGFDMILAAECVALHYFAVLWLAIALMPSQGWRRKVCGWVCCSAVLFGVNVLRLILLGIVGHYFPSRFEIVHDFVWQVVFAVLTFALCFAWTERANHEARSHSSLLFLSLLFATGFALILNIGKIYYLTGLTWLADKCLLLMHSAIPLANRWWAITQKHFVMIRLQGEQVMYRMPNGQEFTVNFWQDLLGMVLFWGLCAGSLLLAIRHRGSDWSLSRALVGIGGGTLLLLLVQVGSLVTLGYLLMSQVDTTTAKNFLWLLRGVSVLLPVLFWWVIWRKSEDKRMCNKSLVRESVSNL